MRQGGASRAGFVIAGPVVVGGAGVEIARLGVGASSKGGFEAKVVGRVEGKFAPCNEDFVVGGQRVEPVAKPATNAVPVGVEHRQGIAPLRKAEGGVVLRVGLRVGPSLRQDLAGLIPHHPSRFQRVVVCQHRDVDQGCVKQA